MADILFNPVIQEEFKATYFRKRRVGKLIDMETGELKHIPWMELIEICSPNNGAVKISIFDRLKQKLVTMRKDDIPKTYTYIPKPETPEEEFEIWITLMNVMNHHIIFPDKNGCLSRDNFAKVYSNFNQRERGRYVGFRDWRALSSINKRTRTNPY